MRRHELTDGQWALIEDMFPRNGQGPGRPWNDHRATVNAMFWVLSTGAPWRDLPGRFGPWQSAYDRFNMYRKDWTLDRIVEHLQMKLDENGEIDRELFCVDGSSVRAHRAAAGATACGLRASAASCCDVSSMHTTGFFGSCGRLYVSSTLSIAHTNPAFCSGGIHHIFFRHGFSSFLS